MCATCGENMSECPGHFGHIELAVPVFHIGQHFARLISVDFSKFSVRFYDKNQKATRDSLPQLREDLDR